MKKYFNLEFLGAFIILLLTLGIFGDVVFSPKSSRVLSAKSGDIYQVFLYSRDFGFSKIQNGHFPLWNPYIFSGTPFFSEFEPALLYPLNWLYIVLPLPIAINTSIVIHFFLLGIFMYLWVKYRGLSVPARVLASSILVLCSAHFMHIYAGHLSLLCTIVWVPLLFLSIDALFDEVKAKWVFIGIFSVSMQVLAGHPQYVLYTGIAALVYVLVRIIDVCQKLKWGKINWMPIAGFIAIYVVAALVTAVQLFPGLDTASQYIRGGNTVANYEFCSSFSFHPENLLTLIMPKFFGDMLNVVYWGRDNIWEMTFFISISGLLLVFCRIFWDKKNIWNLYAITACICLVLAMGKHTPLFGIMYNIVPGFNMLRGSSKFIFLSSMFMALLAGAGMDMLYNENKLLPVKKLAVVLLGISILLSALALVIKMLPTASMSKIMKSVAATNETYFAPEMYDSAITMETLVKPAQKIAVKSVVISAIVFSFLSVAVFFLPKVPYVAYVIGIAGVFELLLFSLGYRFTFDINDTKYPDELRQFFASNPGDYRIFKIPMNDVGHQDMRYGIKNIWGMHIPSERYARFIAFTQHFDPLKTTGEFNFNRYSPFFKMLRCKYAVFRGGYRVPDKEPILEKSGFIVYEQKDCLPRALLIENWRICWSINQIFAEMSKPDFDPLKKVILEEVPLPTPLPVAQQKTEQALPGSVKVTDVDSDTFTIEAKLNRPAVLVMTDPYFPGWQIKNVSRKTIQEYKIIPADYILSAIPLSAGEHNLKVEFLPLSFRIGKWVSIISIVSLFLTGLIYIFKVKNEYLS